MKCTLRKKIIWKKYVITSFQARSICFKYNIYIEHYKQVNILEYISHMATLLPLLAFQYNENQMETNTFSLLVDDIPQQT